MTPFWQGFEKRADDADGPSVASRAGQGAAGGAAVAGGAVAAQAARPLVTGRKRLYHGTSNEAAPGILREGLTPGRGGITEALLGPGEATKRVYMEHRPRFAGMYADQAQRINDTSTRLGIPPTEAAAQNAADPGRQARHLRIIGGKEKPRGRILSADVPAWQLAQHRNPELYGAKNMFDMVDKAEQQFGVRPPLRNAMLHYQVYNTPTFENVPPEFFRDSANYKRLGLKEMGQYLRTHPGRFAGGAALGLGGLTAAGYGANKIYHAAKGDEQ